jgi:YVTN family beta-propeller protein
VNPVTNKIYATNYNSDNVTVIDGITNSTKNVLVGDRPNGIAVNSVTNKIYVANEVSNDVTVIDDVPVNDTKVRVEIDTLPNNVTIEARPLLTGKGVNRSEPYCTNMMGVLNYLNTAQHSWTWAQVTSGAGTDSIHWEWSWGQDSLIAGENLLCMVPLESDAGITNNEGLGTPFVGNMQVYPIYRIVYKDVGVVEIIAPTGTIDSGTVVTPEVKVKNFGTITSSFLVWFKIHSTSAQLPKTDNALSNFGDVSLMSTLNQAGSLNSLKTEPITLNIKPTIEKGLDQIYEDSVLVNLAPGDSTICSFSAWTAIGPDTFMLESYTILEGDINPNNDSAYSSVIVRRPIHDVGVLSILAPTGDIDSGTVVIPKAVAKNFSPISENFAIRFRIGTFYTDDETITLDAGVIDTVEFASWSAIQVGTHITKCTTLLAADTNHINDFIMDSVRVQPFVGISEPHYIQPLPKFFALENNLPNPFGQKTLICYALPKESDISIRIYNSAGKLVRTLKQDIENAGYYRIVWDGKDNEGKMVNYGVYYCRMNAADYKAMKKLIKIE